MKARTPALLHGGLALPGVFLITPERLAGIVARTADGAKFEPLFTVEVRDAAGEVVADVDKQLYVRRKEVG